MGKIDHPKPNRCPPDPLTELRERVKVLEAKVAKMSTTPMHSMASSQKETELKAPAKVTIVVEVSDRT